MGPSDPCPNCGFLYRDLRTGLTYRQVYEFLKDYSDDPTDWTYKRRNTVLGKWHQIKLEQWEWHIAECERQRAFQRLHDPDDPPPF